jgi:hypothetical protein
MQVDVPLLFHAYALFFHKESNLWENREQFSAIEDTKREVNEFQ